MNIKNSIHRTFLMLIKAIKEGFLYILSGNILVKAISMISGIIIVRIIDKNDYAYYSYALNLYSYIDLVAGLGLASALLKYAATGENVQKDKTYFVYAGKMGTAIQFICSIALCTAVSFIRIPFPQARTYIYALVFMPSLAYFLSTVQMYLRGQQLYKQYAATGLLQVVIVCLIGSLLSFKFNATGLVAGRYIAVIISISYGIKVLMPNLRTVKITILGKKEIRLFWEMAISLMLAELFSSIMPANETFLINNLIKDEVVTANFRVAGLIPQQLILVTGSIAIFYFSKIAQIKDRSIAFSQIVRIAILNFCIVFFITVVGIVMSPWIIRILYGEKYMDAVFISNRLWIMRFINVAFRMIPMNFLPAIGETKFNSVCSFFSCIIHIVVDYFCILHFGINGVAYATIVVYVLSSIAFWVYLYYACKIKKINMENC